ncbi:replication protein A 70 kDa DNA-binding subunit B-like [Tasmannia lanceolata]|uniref:replication protein A 70 kDa DNA-binding subunit B-like n=1 Tax=Tasmannia lanceolata TaxID=3420 RepID=UPI004062FC5D
MAKSVTPGAISTLLSNPSPDSSTSIPEIIVQVIDLKPIGSRFKFMANDGKMKLMAMLPSSFSSEINSGNLQNLGLIRILDYTCNAIPNKPEKALIITECEVISPALEMEIKDQVKIEETGIILNPKEIILKNVVDSPATKTETKTEIKRQETGIILKPKQEKIAKSAAQILYEQHGNTAPTARTAMTRRVYPLASLNPYQGIWTIKVRLTSKGNLRTYKNARGEGHVFNVEFTDEDGTQIQATMFNEAANKFYPKFELGKVYYISRGTLKVANKQFKTVQNDYEMTLNESSEVEEVIGEGAFVPETKFNFVPIDQLVSYVNGKELVDIIGVVQNVSTTMSIRRKINNETIPKRDITIADESKKTVTVSLWNDLATNVGQELLDMVDTSPIVAIKSLKVGDFQGVSVSALSKSTVLINPDVPESKKLRSWYDSEGKGASMASVGSSMISNSSKSGARSMYSDRVFLTHITSDPSLGEDKPVFFSTKAYISFIKPDQTMWYRACKTCNKKVTEAIGSGYWCEGCQKNDADCSLRYIMAVKVADASGEAWLSVFNEQAEKIIGCTADELDSMKSEEGGEKSFQVKLKEAMWVPHLFRVSVAQSEYMNEKRQRITIRAQSPVDWSAESRYLLEEISKMTTS